MNTLSALVRMCLFSVAVVVRRLCQHWSECACSLLQWSYEDFLALAWMCLFSVSVVVRGLCQHWSECVCSLLQWSYEHFVNIGPNVPVLCFSGRTRTLSALVRMRLFSVAVVVRRLCQHWSECACSLLQWSYEDFLALAWMCLFSVSVVVRGLCQHWSECVCSLLQWSYEHFVNIGPNVPVLCCSGRTKTLSALVRMCLFSVAVVVRRLFSIGPNVPVLCCSGRTRTLSALVRMCLFSVAVVVRRLCQHWSKCEGAQQQRVHHRNTEGSEEDGHDAILNRPPV